MSKLVALCLMTMSLASAYAGECVIHTTRYACPGQEAESYSKCNGKQSCDQTQEAANVDACAALSLQACANKRYTVTKYKSVTSKFDGKPVSGGIDFCDKDSGDYKVAENFPYRHSADCK